MNHNNDNDNDDDDDDDDDDIPLVISYIDLTLKCMIEIISGCLIYAKI